MEALRTIAVRLALCCIATWAVWRAGFDTGTLFMIGLFGIALARPLLDLAADAYRQIRRASWQAVEGRHYTFQRHPIDVVTDADRQRWIRIADVRRIIGFTASDAALRVTYPRGWRRGQGGEPRLSDEALLAHLLKERSPLAAKLRHWVEREIVFPARRERERLGVRPDAADFQGSD